MTNLFTLRKVLFSIFFSLLATFSFAQAPNGFKYQAVIRDANNQTVNGKAYEVTVKIIQGSASNAAEYTETHNIETSNSGLFSLYIGNGTTSDDFESIDWSDGPYYIKILVDGEEFSTSQLMSVPYSMHATTADKVAGLGVSESGDTLYMNGASYVVPGISGSNAKAYADQILLGGTDNETVTHFLVANDGGYWMAGTTQSFNGDVSGNNGEQDIWVVKLDADKNITWQKCIGGSGYETISNFVLTDDGGCLIGGTSESSNGDVSENEGEFDLLLAKLTSAGSLSWIETYGGGQTEFMNHLSVTSDGGYLVGATTFSHGADVSKNYGDADIWIFKLNASREIEWQKSLGGLRYDALFSLVANDDGTYSVFGITESNDGNVAGNNGSMDMWAATLDASREVTGQVCLGSVDNEDLHAVVSKSSNILLGGLTFASDWTVLNSKSAKNIRLTEINSDLTLVNENQIGGSYAENLVKLIPLSNGTTMVIGETNSQDEDVSGNNGDQDIWVSMVSSSLEISSSVCIGGSYTETISACVELSEGGYLLAGTSESSDGDVGANNGESDIVVIKLTSDLTIEKIATFGGTYAETVLDIIEEENDKFTLVGTTESDNYGIEGFHGTAGKSSDIWILTEGF